MLFKLLIIEIVCTMNTRKTECFIFSPSEYSKKTCYILTTVATTIPVSKSFSYLLVEHLKELLFAVLVEIMNDL